MEEFSTMRKLRRSFTVGASSLIAQGTLGDALRWIALVTRHSVETIKLHYGMHTHVQETVEASKLLHFNLYGFTAEHFPALSDDVLLKPAKDRLAQPVLPPPRVAIEALSFLCKPRASAMSQSAPVEWTWKSLAHFYQDQISHVLVLLSQPNKVAHLMAPFYIGSIFVCSTWPFVPAVSCGCCGLSFDFFPNLSASEFFWKDDEQLCHPLLSQQLIGRIVNLDKLKSLGQIAILMCGKRNKCQKSGCTCNTGAVLIHYETRQLSLQGKTLDWILKKLIWK